MRPFSWEEVIWAWFCMDSLEKRWSKRVPHSTDGLMVGMVRGSPDGQLAIGGLLEVWRIKDSWNPAPERQDTVLKISTLGWVSTTDSPKMNIHIPFSVGVYEDHPLTCCVAKCLWTGYQTTHLQSTLHCADLLFQWVHLLIGFLTHSVGPLKDQ